MAAAAEDGGPRRTESGRFMYAEDMANAQIVRAAIIDVSPLGANKCLYNAIGQAMGRLKTVRRKLEGDVEWVAQQIMMGLEKLDYETEKAKIELYGIQDPAIVPLKKDPSKSAEPFRELPPDTAEGWELWKKYYKAKPDIKKRANGEATEMHLFANSYPETVSFLIFSENRVKNGVDVYAITHNGNDKAALLPDTEEIVLYHWFDGGIAHFDRVEFTLRVDGEENTVTTWPWAGTETEAHEQVRREMVYEIIKAKNLRNEILESIATIRETPSLLDKAPPEVLNRTRDLLVRLIEGGDADQVEEPAEGGAAAAAVRTISATSVASITEHAPPAAAAAAAAPVRTLSAASAASMTAAAAAAAASAPLVRPGTISFYKQHWGKLKKQRDLLYHFAARRDLCAIGKEDEIYAAGGGPRPPQKEPSGHTVRLEDYDLAGSLESKVEIRSVGGMLGVFAKEFLQKKIYGLDALLRVTPKQMLQRVLPYRGIVMTNDTQRLLEYEFACPTAMGLDVPKKSYFPDSIPRGEFTLVGCPTSAATVINSFDDDADPDAEARVNCTYVSMTKEEFEEYGTVQVGRRRHLSDHFLHVCLTKSVNAGDELIIDYGRVFWEQQEDMKERGVVACEECQITMQGGQAEDDGPIVGPDMEEWLIKEMEEYISDARVKEGWSSFSKEEFKDWLMTECTFKGCGRAIHKFHFWPEEEPDEWFCSLHDKPATGASAGAASASAAPSAPSAAASAASSSSGSPARPSKPQAQKRQNSKKKKRKAYIPSSHAEKLARDKRMAAAKAKKADADVRVMMRQIYQERAAKALGAGVPQQARANRDADFDDGEGEAEHEGEGEEEEHGDEEEAAPTAPLHAPSPVGMELDLPTPPEQARASKNNEQQDEENEDVIDLRTPPSSMPRGRALRTPPSLLPRGRGESNVLDLTLSEDEGASSDSSKEHDGAPRQTQYRRASQSAVEAEREAAAALAEDEMFPQMPVNADEDDEDDYYAPATPQTPDDDQPMIEAMLRLRLDRNRKKHNS